MEDKITAVLFSFLILAQAWGVRLYVGTWIFPACLFGLLWFMATLVPMILAPSVPIEPFAVGYILSCCVIYSASAVAFDWRFAFRTNSQRPIDACCYDSVFLKWALYLTVCIAILSLGGNWLIQGISLSDVVFSLARVSNEYIAKRYSGEIVPNIFGQIAIVLTYVAATIGGCVYGERKSESYGFFVLTIAMIPSIFIMLIEAAKGAIFQAIAFFVAGALTTKLAKNDLHLFKPQVVVRVFCYVLLLTPAVFFAFLVRGIGSSGDIPATLNTLSYYIISYSSGHLFAFSDWFAGVIGHRSLMSYFDEFGTNGFYTFMAVAKLFGSDRGIPPGTYEEYFAFEDILQTNIYTMFRGLIVDYYIFGSLVVIAVFGFLSHLFFFLQISRKNSVLAVAFFTHLIGFFYSSVFISLLAYNSVYVSFFVVSLILYFNKSFVGKPNRFLRFS